LYIIQHTYYILLWIKCVYWICLLKSLYLPHGNILDTLLLRSKIQHLCHKHGKVIFTNCKLFLERRDSPIISKSTQKLKLQQIYIFLPGEVWNTLLKKPNKSIPEPDLISNCSLERGGKKLVIILYKMYNAYTRL